VPDFRNQPLTDFGQPQERSAMERALAQVRDEFDRDWPLVIGGSR